MQYENFRKFPFQWAQNIHLKKEKKIVAFPHTCFLTFYNCNVLSGSLINFDWVYEVTQKHEKHFIKWTKSGVPPVPSRLNKLLALLEKYKYLVVFIHPDTYSAIMPSYSVSMSLLSLEPCLDPAESRTYYYYYYYYSLLLSQWYRLLQQTWFTGIAFNFLNVSSFFFWHSFSSLIMDGIADLLNLSVWDLYVVGVNILAIFHLPATTSPKR